MSVERVLDNNILLQLRESNVISTQEVAIQVGDLYFAKDVLTNEKRMISLSGINTQSINETTTKQQLLKG
jgi:hypothetical protein